MVRGSRVATSVAALVVCIAELQLAGSVRLDDDDATPLAEHHSNSPQHKVSAAGKSRQPEKEEATTEEGTTTATAVAEHNTSSEATSNVTAPTAEAPSNVTAPSKSLQTVQEELQEALGMAEQAKDHKDKFKLEMKQLLKSCYADRVSLKEQLIANKKLAEELHEKLEKCQAIPEKKWEVSHIIANQYAEDASKRALEKATTSETAEHHLATAKDAAEKTHVVTTQHAEHAVEEAMKPKTGGSLVELSGSQDQNLREALAAANKAKEEAEERARQAQQNAADIYEKLEMAKRAGFLMKEAGEACNMLQNGRDCLSNTCLCDWKMSCTCQPLMK